MTNPMKQLYKRLEAAGVPQNYIKKTALPDWWEDKIADHPAGYIEIISILSDHLSLSIRDLQDAEKSLKCEPSLTMKNKASQGVRPEQMTWARCLCARAAQIACAGVVTPPSAVPTSAAQVRHIICKDAHHVNLESLLDYCWSLGIPVLHLSEFPKVAGSKKPDGAAVRVGSRHAIVLSKNTKYSAWQVFILAHELGHIALGHLKENGLYVDEGTEWKQEREQEEGEANAFAIELLTGDHDTVYQTTTPLTGKAMAEAARYFGRTQRVDPGIIVLNYARDTERWGVAMTALNLLEPDADAPRKIRALMASQLNEEALSSENRDFLWRLSGMDTYA